MENEENKINVEETTQSQIENTENTTEIKETQVIEEPKKDSQSRRYMLTYNNPTESDEEFYNFLQNLEHIKYFMFSREKAPTTGTIHFQMFLIFKIGKRFSTIKNLFPNAHIEQAQKTSAQCREYCSKSDTHVSGPYEYGEFAEERSRTDIKNFYDLIYAGVSNMELQKLYPNLYLRQINNIDKIRRDVMNEEYAHKLRENLKVVYLYGQSRTGKTYNVLNHYGLNKVYRVTDYYKDPWENYMGQKTLIFDEFRSQFNVAIMLNYLDIYPISLSSRYNNKVACFDTIFIISNIPPSSQYTKTKEEEPETYKAFNERLHHVIYLTKEKCEVQKTKDLEELKQLLPQVYLDKLDTSPIERKEQIKMVELYTPIDEDPIF